MRIRRRPQALIPSPPPQQQASDPSTALSQPPPPPPNAPAGNQHHWPPRYEEDNHKSVELHSNVDLVYEPSPAPAARRVPSPQQGDNVVGRRSDSPSGRTAGAQRQGAATADGHGHTHGSLDDGHREECDWPATNAAGKLLVNRVIVPAEPLASMAPLNVKEGIKSDGPKRRRGPAVLLEGSRCSRVNGRGWRCSQPTLVGYSLCEHHLTKGRQSRSANGNSGGGGRVAGAPKLGRTEPVSRKSASPLALSMDGIEPVAAHLAAKFS
ncbi:hypothetical protein ACQ4PT_034765 [Festuca glaucescens]